jgi:pyruvate kinase
MKRAKTVCIGDVEKVTRPLSFSRGVSPLLIRPLAHTDEMGAEIEQSRVNRKIVKKGDSIIMISHSPFTISGKTNFIQFYQIE